MISYLSFTSIKWTLGSCTWPLSLHVAAWASSHHGCQVPVERKSEREHLQKPCLLYDLALGVMRHHFPLIPFVTAITKYCLVEGKRLHILMGKIKLPQGRTCGTGNITAAILGKYLPHFLQNITLEFCLQAVPWRWSLRLWDIGGKNAYFINREIGFSNKTPEP